MEFMEGGTLAQAARDFTFQEKEIAFVAREMLKALSFLHSKKYAHRDLKSSNVMMTIQGQVKLSRFLSRFTSFTKSKPIFSRFWSMH
jgi:p21-activated kinase 1